MPLRTQRPADEVVLRVGQSLIDQIQEEIRSAAAGRNLSLKEVARRMGDPTGAGGLELGGRSRWPLADVGTAMGVTFLTVAIPTATSTFTLTVPDRVEVVQCRPGPGGPPQGRGRANGLSTLPGS